jgi:3'(2'), 5'-bisphosphate nucleotidase
MDRSALLERVVPVARAAGEAILEVYATDFRVRAKPDTSPVTEADDRAEAVIRPALAALTPGLAVVSEEFATRGNAPVVGERFWLVDPLDGTREFIARNGEFTVNIALVEQDTPVLGLVLAPALGLLFAGTPEIGAYAEQNGHRSPIACRRPPPGGLTVISSRSHGDTEALAIFLAGRRIASATTAGSSLKFCKVAAGEADLYPRFGRTMEWDTAAGHAILVAAGGRVIDLDGRALRYGKPQFANPQFVAMGPDL